MIDNKQQTQVSITGLTYNSLLQDVYNALRDSEFAEDFTDFSSSTAERMIAELFCYVAMQLSDRMDQIGNELFTDTASIEGLSRLLKTVGYKLPFQEAASVLIETSTADSTGEELVFSPGIDPGVSSEYLMPTLNSFKGISLESNNNIRFEFIAFDGSTNTYDYCKPVIFTTPYKKSYLYGGQTVSQSYIINSIKKNVIQLKQSPVINNSVEVYYRRKLTSSSSSGYNVVRKFKKVDNFFSTEALTTTDTGTYTVNNLGNGVCELILQPTDNDMGEELIIMYRINGGSQGNISIGAINNAEQRKLINGTTMGTVSYYNTASGSGGKDEPTADQIRYDVSQATRNTKIAVTEEDYEYWLPKLDSSIRYLETYGEKNETTEALSKAYGYYLNPLNVWLFILKYVKSVEDAYNNDSIEKLTNYINDIVFETLDLTQRFNECYSVNEGFLNQGISGTSMNASYTKTQTSTFELDQGAADALRKGNNIITITRTPYIETRDPERRGYLGFEKYAASDYKGEVDELPEASEANRGYVYMLTSSADGELNTRWKSTGTTWEKVQFTYYYDNLVAEIPPADDTKYIDQGPVSDSPMYLYSMVDSAFRADFGSEGIELTSGTTLVINGTTITFSVGNYTAEEMASYINSHLIPKTYMATLKDNIPYSALNAEANIVSLQNADSTLFFTQNGSTYEIHKGAGSNITYADLIDTINDALDANNLNAHAFLLSSNNDCSKLVIASSALFTVSESDTELTAETSFLTYYLQNTNDSATALSITAELEEIGTENADLDDYAATYSDDSFVTSEGNTLIIRFDSDTTQTTLSSNSATLIQMFIQNASSNTTYTAYDRRTFTLTYSSASNTARLSLTISNPNDKPSDPLYINIFGSTVTSIKLGSYYTDIENTMPSEDYSAELAQLLKRDALTKLYSTKYIEDKRGNVSEDIYGSEYQVKFSSKKVISSTFNQISNEASPAYVTLQISPESVLKAYTAGTYLYFRVDAVDFSSSRTYTFTDDEDISHTITISPFDGYARIDVSTLSGFKASHLAYAMLQAYYNDITDTNALSLYYEEDIGLIRIRTTMEDYASSIDFGNTAQSVLEYLFGLTDQKVVTSEIGAISPIMIDYKRVGVVTENYYFLHDFKLAVTNSPEATPSYVTVNTSSSIDALADIIASSELGDSITVDNRRLVFTDRQNGHTMWISLPYSSAIERNNWIAMFALSYGQSWADTGSSLDLSLSNQGDYYISITEPDSAGNIYQLTVLNKDAFPYGNVYVHMFEDYSYDHLIAIDDYTDEYQWNTLLQDKKVMLTNHVYEQPRFLPFDLSVTCYIPNNIGMYRTEEYQKKVYDFLRSNYGVYTSNMGNDLTREDVILAIKENIPEIVRVDVDYFGFDMTESSTNKGMISAAFNQKLIIASNETDSTMTVANGVQTTVSKLVHGLTVTMKYSN